MQINNCANCNHKLAESYQFCPQCSQKKAIHRITIGYLLHEFFHAFTHADKSILHLFKQLGVNPGLVLREYIFEGKRKKYFNPFTFLLLVLGFTVVMNTYFHPFSQPIKPELNERIKNLPASQQKKALEILEKSQNVNVFFEKKSNWVTLLSTPVISFVFWIMFRKKKINYAEHLVAYIFMIGFLMFVTTLIFTPLIGFTKGSKYQYIIIISNLIIQLVYFSWSYKNFLNLQSKKEILRVTLASFLGIVLWAIVSVLAVFIYFIFF